MEITFVTLNNHFAEIIEHWRLPIYAQELSDSPKLALS